MKSGGLFRAVFPLGRGVASEEASVSCFFCLDRFDVDIANPCTVLFFGFRASIKGLFTSARDACNGLLALVKSVSRHQYVKVFLT